MLGVWSGMGTAPVLHEFTFPPTSGPSGIVFCKVFLMRRKEPIEGGWTIETKNILDKAVKRHQNLVRYDFEWFWMISNDFVCLFVFAWSRRSHAKRILSTWQSPKSTIFSCAVQAAPVGGVKHGEPNVVPTCANQHSCTNGHTWSVVVWTRMIREFHGISMKLWVKMLLAAPKPCKQSTHINVKTRPKRNEKDPNCSKCSNTSRMSIYVNLLRRISSASAK